MYFSTTTSSPFIHDWIENAVVIISFLFSCYPPSAFCSNAAGTGPVFSVSKLRSDELFSSKHTRRFRTPSALTRRTVNIREASHIAYSDHLTVVYFGSKHACGASIEERC